MLRRVRAPVALLFPICSIGCSYDFDVYLPTGENDAAIVVANDARSDSGVTCTDANAQLFEGHCYFPLATAGSFDRAQSACAAAGAHLVTITSAGEEAFVETIRSGRDRWIGLRRPNGADPRAASSFAWITGESTTFGKWGSTEPNDSGPCARLRGSNDWGDQSCGTSYEAICERE